jgi:hypothetical protein
MIPSSVCQHRFGRGGAQQQHSLRLQDGEGPLDERRADGLFLRRGRAVAGRPPEDGVGDEDLAGQARCVEHLVQQLARLADERQSLRVLVRPGASPMTKIGASAAPRPNTDWRAPMPRRSHASQIATAAASASRVSAPAASRRASEIAS